MEQLAISSLSCVVDVASPVRLIGSSGLDVVEEVVARSSADVGGGSTRPNSGATDLSGVVVSITVAKAVFINREAKKLPVFLRPLIVKGAILSKILEVVVLSLEVA